jgi:hypothetical protein
MKKQKIVPGNEVIMTAYMNGWHDCSNGIEQNDAFKDSKILNKAYCTGYIDYALGDDLPSLDLQSEKEILKRILSK